MGGQLSTVELPFKPLAHIDNGTFGDVYQGVEVATNTPVAIKVERVAKTSKRRKMLEREHYIYDCLQNQPGIPRILCTTTTPENEPVIIMELLGPSIESLFQSRQHKFSVSNVMNIGIQCIGLLRTLHTLTPYVHGDVKPNNFLIGRGGDRTRIYMIDYGLAKLHRDLDTNEVIPCTNNNGISGTARYISLNVHEGIKQSPRDDLESLVYMLLYLLKGSLPWQSMACATKKEKYAKIYHKKRTMDHDILFAYTPDCIRTLYNYVRGLKYVDIPNYTYMQTLLVSYCKTHDIELTACTLSTVLF